jgi:hypothetical protein
MYTDPTAAPSKVDRLTHAYEFQTYSLENRARTCYSAFLEFGGKRWPHFLEAEKELAILNGY